MKGNTVFRTEPEIIARNGLSRPGSLRSVARLWCAMAQMVPEWHGFHDVKMAERPTNLSRRELGIRADHPKGVDCFKIRDSTPVRRTRCAWRDRRPNKKTLWQSIQTREQRT